VPNLLAQLEAEFSSSDEESEDSEPSLKRRRMDVDEDLQEGTSSLSTNLFADRARELASTSSSHGKEDAGFHALMNSESARIPLFIDSPKSTSPVSPWPRSRKDSASTPRKNSSSASAAASTSTLPSTPPLVDSTAKTAPSTPRKRQIVEVVIFTPRKSPRKVVPDHLPQKQPKRIHLPPPPEVVIPPFLEDKNEWQQGIVWDEDIGGSPNVY
jgi:hypothetical protein